MKRGSYQETINKIKATESFKADTITKMQNELKKGKPEAFKKKHGLPYKSIGAIAACCAVALSIGILANRQINGVNQNKTPKQTANNNKPTKILNPALNNIDPANLPKLTVSNEFGGMGYEALAAYKVEELKDGNPWTTACNLTSMPVFKNTVALNGDGTRQQSHLTGDEMIKKAKGIANKMSLKIKKVYTEPTKDEIEAQEKKTGVKPDTTPTIAVAICDDIRIEVGCYGNTDIWYKPSISITSKYSFTRSETNDSQAKEVLSYLTKKYSKIIDMKSPALSIYGDYSFDGMRNLSYKAYEGDGDILSKILGYNFNTVSFFPDDDGKLSLIRREKTDLSKIIGNYPIITAAEARNLLIEKHYITTVPEDLPDQKYIADESLVYRNSVYDKVLMPYYRFLVEMPTNQLKNGLKSYGVFYVPAVKGEYLTNMPLWNGEFN